MENKKNIETKVGYVVEALPNTMFRVGLQNEDSSKENEVILAYLSGKMRLNRIRVLIGDRVEMEIDPYGGKARIIRRN
ncbi:MAG: translation initiation factor translation initiation factor [Candidatus Taylorbacteria bacterium]|nr:translation initiation factor translation initiation factor [Candidatus Taylorbacteria bacterium]